MSDLEISNWEKQLPTTHQVNVHEITWTFWLVFLLLTKHSQSLRRITMRLLKLLSQKQKFCAIIVQVIPRTFLSDFYPFYLSEHSNRTSRRLHFIGTTTALVLLVSAFITQFWWLVVVALLQGYAFAWMGHFFFENNKPATFEHPWLSFLGDWLMWWEILTGKIRF